jgi:hypothetical protein
VALFDVHPWARFIAGMLIGCWAGAVVACAGVLLLVGRRVRQLETTNLLLRTRLKARAVPLKQHTGIPGSHPVLVMPMPGKADSSMGRIARVN